MKGINRREVVKIVQEAIIEFNELQVSPTKKILFDEDTKLYGAGGNLSSIELVTFIVELEYKLEEQLGLSESLTSEKAMSQKNSPFRTIGTIVDYICSLEVE